MLIKPNKFFFKKKILLLHLYMYLEKLWYVFWGNYHDLQMRKTNQINSIMQYKVIDRKSQYFGKVLDFESCATLNDLGGVLLKIGRNKVSLFKFNEVEMI